jgi:hypothetical protein
MERRRRVLAAELPDPQRRAVLVSASGQFAGHMDTGCTGDPGGGLLAASFRPMRYVTGVGPYVASTVDNDMRERCGSAPLVSS